jgi:hypothetical protein
MPAGPAPITATWVRSSPRGEADIVMDQLSTKSALQARPAEIRAVEPVGPHPARDPSGTDGARERPHVRGCPAPLSDAVVSSQSGISAEPAAVARVTPAALRDPVRGRQASSVSASTRWAIRKAVLASGTPQ